MKRFRQIFFNESGILNSFSLVILSVFFLLIFVYALNNKNIGKNFEERISKIEERLDKVEKNLNISDTNSASDTDGIISDLKFRACAFPLEGEGIILTLDDSTRETNSNEDPNLYLIHDDDILRVINELKAAGAEAISINGQRLTATSEIRCAGPTLSVNNVRTAAPFEISAIGEKKSLENSIMMRGGVAETLKVWGIQIDLKVSDNVYIPPYKGTTSHVYSKIVEEKNMP